MEPRDPTKTGWTVLAVVFEQPELARYHVRYFDGRPAIMEVAVAGSMANQALVAFAQTLAPGMILDQGIDLAGRTFVIAHPVAFAPPAPPPPLPRPPPPPGAASKSMRNVLLGIGGLTAVASGFFIWKGSQEPPKPKLRMTMSGSWDTGCHPSYRLIVTTRSRAKVKVLDREETVDYSGEVTFTFTEAELADKPELVVEADHEKGYGKETFEVEPDTQVVPYLSDANYVGDGYGTPEGSYTVGTDAPIELGSGYGYGSSSSSSGIVRIEMNTCQVAAKASQEGGVGIEPDLDSLTITIDLGEQMLRYAGTAEPEKLEVPLTLATDDGKPIALNLKLDPLRAYTDNPAYARMAAVATTPIAEAPAIADVAAPSPVLMIWNGNLDRELLGDAAPIGAPYIAIVKTDSKDSGSCGPYSQYGGYYGGTYADRYRIDADVKLYEARTGKLVAKKYFKGKKPSCPSYVTSYGGSISSVDGDPPNVTAWIKKQRQ